MKRMRMKQDRLNPLNPLTILGFSEESYHVFVTFGP